MNLQFSLSKTLRVEGLEILNEEAVVFSSESFIEEEEKEEKGEDSCIEGSQSPKMLEFVESEEAEDMVNMKRLV